MQTVRFLEFIRFAPATYIVYIILPPRTPPPLSKPNVSIETAHAMPIPSSVAKIATSSFCLFAEWKTMKCVRVPSLFGSGKMNINFLFYAFPFANEIRTHEHFNVPLWKSLGRMI